MEFDVVAMPKLPDGKPVGTPLARTLEADLTPDNEARLREHGLTYASALELPPGQYSVRFVVRDSSGRTGSLAAPLAVVPYGLPGTSG